MEEPELRGGRQPCDECNGRHRSGNGSLQKRQRSSVTEQAAVVRSMVRLVLGGQREGLAHEGETDQQEHE